MQGACVDLHRSGTISSDIFRFFASLLSFFVFLSAQGYKVIEGLAAIQGDGINYHTVREILSAVQREGFSAQNVAFGMGGGLLQRVNRDTMSFATKLSYIEYADGSARDVMKVRDAMTATAQCDCASARAFLCCTARRSFQRRGSMGRAPTILSYFFAHLLPCVCPCLPR